MSYTEETIIVEGWLALTIIVRPIIPMSYKINYFNLHIKQRVGLTQEYAMKGMKRIIMTAKY